MTRGNTSLFRLRRKQFTSSLLTLLSICLLLLVTLKYSYLVEPPGAANPGAAVDADVHTFRRYNIDCLAIYDEDPVEVGRSLVIRKTPEEEEDDDEGLANLTSNCPRYLRSRGYGDARVSREEWDFPIAYSLVVHKSAWAVETLVHALYSPANVFCIHYDRKSSARFVDAMEGLARCLPNVFIASERESVFYAGVSRLKADLHCLSDLLGSEVKWKYVINLCGQDFPLRSNAELVTELRRLNGSNMLETSRPSAYKRERFSFHYELRDASFEYQKIPVKTGQRKIPPPHGIQMFIGSAYFVLSREFVEYTNSAPLVRDFLAWSEDTYSPDEHFWATLVRVPGAPGEVSRSRPDITDLMSKTRLVKWSYLEGPLYPQCTGKHMRSVCIYGVGELRWLLNYGHWFANKVDSKVDPVLIQCLEEQLREKQRLFQSRTGPRGLRNPGIF